MVLPAVGRDSNGTRTHDRNRISAHNRNVMAGARRANWTLVHRLPQIPRETTLNTQPFAGILRTATFPRTDSIEPKPFAARRRIRDGRIGSTRPKEESHGNEQEGFSRNDLAVASRRGPTGGLTQGSSATTLGVTDADQEMIAPDRCVLLVVDVQHEFCTTRAAFGRRAGHAPDDRATVKSASTETAGECRLRSRSGSPPGSARRTLRPSTRPRP